MKYLLLLGFLSFSLFSCNPTPSEETTEATDEPVDVGGPQDDPDLIAIDSVIHSFYIWYEAFQKDESRNIIYTSDKGKHLVLDMPKLDQFYANLKSSGFISDEFIGNDKAMLKKCEMLWQNEDKNEPPSCLDGDRFFCAQDWDMDFWSNAPVGGDGLGSDQVVATMSGTEGGSNREQKFDLKKENGKWLITKIYCDIGVD